MNRRRALCWLLYLYPQVFRERFGEEIHEYVAMRRLEVEPAGRVSLLLFTADVALELAAGALKAHVHALSPAKIAVHCIAMTVGLMLAIALLGAPFVACANLIRMPLLRMSKSGGDGFAVAMILGALIVAIVALTALYCYAQNAARRYLRCTAHRRPAPLIF